MILVIRMILVIVVSIVGLFGLILKSSEVRECESVIDVVRLSM